MPILCAVEEVGHAPDLCRNGCVTERRIQIDQHQLDSLRSSTNISMSRALTKLSLIFEILARFHKDFFDFHGILLTRGNFLGSIGL